MANTSLKRLEEVPAIQPPVAVRVSSRITLWMFQTGWVAVKRQHRHFSGISALRLPAIMASRSWTEWMPVTAYAIEHPDGLLMVDTGETTRINDPEHTACDAITGLFYRRNLRFAVSAEQEIGPQMRAAGLDPERVSTVVMTHLHSDHMGGMGWFRHARFVVSNDALNGHAGALMCRMPANVRLTPTDFTDQPTGAFLQSAWLTRDGSLAIVPTPGHATGHQSLLVNDEGQSVCIVGDAAFSLEQIETGEIGGIVESVSDARASASLLRTQFREWGTVMLPTHDPGNAARMETTFTVQG